VKHTTFKRAERLKSRKAIELLFRKGASFGQYPLRLVYLPLQEQPEGHMVKIAVSVPKKKFAKAVHRNRIKRQIREAWRLHKSILYKKLPPQSPPFAFMIIYVAKEAVSYQEIEQAVKSMIFRFAKKWKKQYQPPVKE
jgi:ribonuclease P protein component